MPALRSYVQVQHDWDLVLEDATTITPLLHRNEINVTPLYHHCENIVIPLIGCTMPALRSYVQVQHDWDLVLEDNRVAGRKKTPLPPGNSSQNISLVIVYCPPIFDLVCGSI
jgi:hypothetical protein